MRLDIRLRLSLMMFLQYFVWGAWYVTLWTYLTKLGYTSDNKGWCFAAMPIAAMISPFFVGVVADRFFPTQRVLAVLHLLGGALLLFVAGAFGQPLTTFPTMFPVLLLYALCYMPTLALTNALSFRQMQDPSAEFPGIRVLGTIGWIAAGTLIGLLRLTPDNHFTLEFLRSGTAAAPLASIETTRYPMLIAGGTSLLLGLFCLALPHTPPSQGGKVSLSQILGLDALQLMREPSFAVFVIGSFLICIPLQFYYALANPFLNAVNFYSPAFSMTFGQWSEIGFMLLMPLFFARLGVKKMLLFGVLAWVLRYWLFSVGASFPFEVFPHAQGASTGINWVGLSTIGAGILLHGICYDFFFVTGQIYVDRKAPPELRGAAQGFIAFVTLGAGLFIGSILSGRVQSYYATSAGAETYNWHQLWRVPALLALAVMLIFAFSFREKPTSTSNAIQS